MNDGWTYVGMTTCDGLATLATVRPRWRLTVGGRKPRGEWEAALLDLRRDDQESTLTWLHRNLTEGRAPVGDSPRVRLLLDASEPGSGDLLSRAVARRIDLYPVFRRLLVNTFELVDRHVDRGTRDDGTQTVSRRDVLAPLLEAVAERKLSVPRNSMGREFADQATALRQKTARDEPGNEDLVRAVALCVWAIEREGGGRLRGFAGPSPINVH